LIAIFILILSSACRQKSYETEIREIAESTNKNLPMMVDSETRFESVLVKPGKVYQYNYTLINIEKRNFDVADFSIKQKKTILNGIKSMSTKSGFKFFVENGVTLSFIYDDKNGDNILNISIPPSEYK
jgi:hypothetical protein